MFAITCPHHGARTLVPIDAIRRLEPTPDGFEIEAECWCGGIVTAHIGHPSIPAGTAV